MGFQDFISEAEAATRAGVSARTLQRFAEAGYLHVEIEPDGLRLYPRTEIEEIFGIHQSPLVATAEETGDSRNVGTFGAAANSEIKHTQRLADLVEKFSDANTGLRRTTEATPEAAPGVAPESEPAPLADGPLLIGSSAPSFPSGDSIVDASPSREAQDELTRLRNLVKVQEQLLDLKESDIKDLRSQRDWLQIRVERLEEKSDRDQILLLSETQTIRRLISLQEEKRSTFRQLLEWLGFSTSKPIALPAPKGIVTEPASHSSSSQSEQSKVANG